MKKVYIAMSADIIHHGHLNVIKEANKYGEVIVGLHTDKVISEYWRNPVMKYEERKTVVESIKGVSKVIPQETLDQVPNLLKIKPDYVVHGDDWKEGLQKNLRAKVINTIKQWGGELIEVRYTEGTSISKLENAIMSIGTTPQKRMKKLKELIYSKGIVRILEAHNGLTGLIVEKTKVEKDGKIKEFDGMWVSSLCDSTAKGKPDIELVDLTSRLNTINDILEVTTKPIILDGDTGGKVEHFVYTVKTLERLGVSAIIIEDKVGLKKNSLFGTEVKQTQDTIDHFCEKIRAGREARVTGDFMIISRIESLIAKAGMDDALERAKAYIDAGTDGIMIHSKEVDGTEIIEFCRKYNKFEKRVPLVVVPTSYNFMTESELRELGINVVIYANHLIRSAYPAMVNTAKSILENERSKEASEYCMPIKEILNLIPGGK
ncbi:MULTISPECIES: phosphoenolpyruvate mutase [Clostridium]|uniref:phosphoenolpyruvate mutase n=1 Tax=Clostridium TaxID=1485 RepID=UPI00290349DB|nr:phosphoenolpyruvate mutase [Clostridium sp.]MDU1969310.1 phosphoenolpyruvate mutase [Clostridium perfringens]MDU1824578.1 phosphoenolpyruvate mutase [Clostridium sp.]MDU1842094.1 phosphoenolpyruvate mutase [Clostridium sp.]MDU2691661.1 phosphoenolpyruvate mutase [Clostridium sp.]MDU2957511.1 phosphoenolpyruvate mutase [Clostridium sp.]